MPVSITRGETSKGNFVTEKAGINRFFREIEIDIYVVATVEDMNAPPGCQPIDILPNVKRLIVFGKAVPRFIFELNSRVKSFYMFQLIRRLDFVSLKLAENLNQMGHQSVPITGFFPIRIIDGKIKGVLSIKHAAAASGMGTLGLNTLLINSEFGNRLVLSCVLTENEMETSGVGDGGDLCKKCGKCIEACPTGAIDEGRVKAVKCINFSNPVPWALRPILPAMAGWSFSARYLEIAVNTLGWNVQMECSRCLTACPYYNIG